MSRCPLALTRLLGLGVLCLGVVLVGCGDSATSPLPPLAKSLPDAALSTVQVDRVEQVLADGVDRVTITVTVRQKDGAPMEGRMVRVEVSGDGNTVTQPADRTNAQGVATASVVSTRGGSKRVTASVDAEEARWCWARVPSSASPRCGPRGWPSRRPRCRPEPVHPLAGWTSSSGMPTAARFHPSRGR
ncbi:Ig-like domain-containing protein [Myxococcus sp. MxC21-1]|uniref:Ig-like domain-containing protein n=1 Tax=Myxococcus sp. MxC21-1 TaxID=3041439 RepID=UPI00292D5325|nr:Ig-like domain-containing protein [Myxococcus sp. MxC21-1]WNZ60567.1 Ig-like domain-containing protein [Myxococcus sp. MxC21-1]